MTPARLLGGLLLGAALLPGAALGGVPAGREAAAMAVLEAAREAVLAAEHLHYRYTFGGPGEAAGHLTGTVDVVRPRGDAELRLRVEGEAHAVPPGSGLPAAFAYAEEGGAVRLVDHPAAVLRSASGAAAGALAAPRLYTVLPEFLDRDPYWMPRKHAESVESLGVEALGGVDCDVVRVTYPEMPGQGRTSTVWHIGRDDRLPRAQRWSNPVQGAGASLAFALDEIRTGPAPSGLELAVPEGYRRETVAAPPVEVGDTAPDWTLPAPGGRPVRLAALRGRVVVIDFWTTWCVLCQALMPEMQALHERYRDRPLSVLGVNLWETGDPVAAWSAKGNTYPLLLDGDGVAAAYEVTSQPAVVVVGPDGRILHRQVGASGDRNARVREVVETALGSLSGDP